VDQDGSQRLGEGMRAQITDDRSIALAGLEQTDQLEDTDGVANRGPADAEPLGQLTFWGEPVAGMKAAFDDEAANPVGDLFVDLGPPNGLELADDRGRGCGDS